MSLLEGELMSRSAKREENTNAPAGMKVLPYGIVCHEFPSSFEITTDRSFLALKRTYGIR